MLISFKKAVSPSKKDSVPVQADEEPVQKGKRVKRAAKKPSNTPATGIVIREPTVETKSKGKEKEKVDVAHGKGIELLSDVALTEEAQMKEVRKKSLRDFHKTHPSGSGTVAKDPPSKVSSQTQSTYEVASTLTEFELKKILLDKMEKSESYLTAPEHRDCYDGLKKSYALDKDFFYSYDVYSLKRGRKDKDKDEDPSAGSDRGLKKRKTSKDAEPTTGPKKKDSTSGSSKGTKSQPKSTRKSVQSEEPVFEVADSDMPQDQAGNLGDNEDEPRDETASRRDWFKKPTPPQEPTDPDWNVGKTTKEGPTQTWLMNLAASNPTDKSLKDFDELISTPIDFSGLLKGTRSNYAELEYDFEECYKVLSEKLDWENPKGGDYLFDLSKPLPFIKSGKRQRVPFEFFINNDLKYL
ncbi:hypothetical protein Tco_1001386 [Tanacetum coccineum]